MVARCDVVRGEYTLSTDRVNPDEGGDGKNDVDDALNKIIRNY